MKKRLRTVVFGIPKNREDLVQDWQHSHPMANPDRLRARIDHEDSLLNARTNIFLVWNGLAAVAVSLGEKTTAHASVICIVALVLNILWLLCVRQSIKVLAALTGLLEQHPEDHIEGLVQQFLGRCHWLRPTTILAVYLPCITIVAWVVAVVIAVA